MEKKLRLKPIDPEDLEDVPVFEPNVPRVPALRGEAEEKGKYTFVCHNEDCDFPVFKRLHKDAVKGAAARCGKCGEYSYFPE